MIYNKQEDIMIADSIFANISIIHSRFLSRVLVALI